jgi:serine/threonine protein kinase
VAKVPDRVGQIIGQRYELLQVVGRGGQGMVYRALDRWGGGREVAVKVLGSKAAREPQMVERLMREQQAMSALKGTSAVELFDVCRGNDGELCLVMELLKGSDLDEHLFALEERRERLVLPRIAEIFDPIVGTLEVAHAAGILHRDLKPANIFLLENGDVRLLDFGMARLKKSAPLTAAGTVMGSPSFMAPEAWKGVSDLLDHRADVYSLGVILFRVLAGQLPFAGDSLKDKLLGATTASRPSLRKLRPDLPRDADEWVSTALAVDREQRFGNVRALWHAFLTVFRVEPPQRGRRPSFWQAAKGAVQRVVGTNRPQPPPAHPTTGESSFAREALLRTDLHRDAGLDEEPAALAPTAAAPAPEPTIELTEADFARAARPPPPPPRQRPVEQTLSMRDEDIAYGGDSSPQRDKPSPPKP